MSLARNALPETEPVWAAAEERYAYVREVLMRELPPPADLIELGAAPGVQSLALARVGYHVTAVDLGEAPDAWGDESSSTVEGTMGSAFEKAGVELVLWDLEQVPYPLADESFDIVLLTEVLEHLRDYPLRTLTEAHRILRPGGMLLLTTPNAASLQNRVRLAFGGSVHTPLRDWMFGLPHARHAREYTTTELRELVGAAGLDIVSLESRHFHTASGRQDRLAVAAKLALDRLARVRPSMGPGLAVLARRPSREADEGVVRS
jgi:2-polyprenyl-3-methyl-5-hydroxy-6-metoxy-1,4-benzoquinol methylase